MGLDLLLFQWPMPVTGNGSSLPIKTSLISDRFAEAVLKGLSGEKNVIEPSFVYLPGVPGGEAIFKETGCEFFSVPVELGVSSLHLLTH